MRNSRDLVKPGALRWKVLIVGRPGVGKTSWLSTAPGLGIAACETGHGRGLLSVAHRGVNYVEPSNFVDFRSICLNTFDKFQPLESIGLDSLTAMTRTFIKDHVLANFPAKNSREALRRQAGVPVGFDYGDIAAVTQALLSQLINLPKNIVVTALEKATKNDDGVITSIGPDLPGQLSDGAPAMFDSVLYLKVRKVLRDPKDPRSVFFERYFVTGNDGFHIGKDRNSDKFKSFLSPEEVFDPERQLGTFPILFDKILAGHSAATASALTTAAPTQGQ